MQKTTRAFPCICKQTHHPRISPFCPWTREKAREYVVGRSWFELAGHTRFPLFSSSYCFLRGKYVAGDCRGNSVSIRQLNRHNAMKDTVLIRMTEYHCSSTALPCCEWRRKMERGLGEGIFTRSNIGFYL